MAMAVIIAGLPNAQSIASVRKEHVGNRLGTAPHRRDESNLRLGKEFLWEPTRPLYRISLRAALEGTLCGVCAT
jgi:hypothetical protein